MDIFDAIEHSDKKELNKLLESKIDVNLVDELGQSLLHLAIDTAFEEAIYIYDLEKKIVQPRLDVIEILIAYGANHQLKDKNGKTPIDWAKERKNHDFLSDLVGLIEKNMNTQK